jgi:hypothetical protein
MQVVIGYSVIIYGLLLLFQVYASISVLVNIAMLFINRVTV